MENNKTSSKTIEPKVSNETLEAVEVHEFENCPFNGVKTGSNNWKIVLGDQVISRMEFDTKEKAQEYIDGKPWELIMVATAIYTIKVNN